ncbi:MAG: UDP-4-amino-4,6-dideoxy-N-acetyl-beta-L-altrosamine transaminase [Candidatus Peregrinibacteria bacterium]
MPAPLALYGGFPVRSTLLPYSRPSLSPEAGAAIEEVLRSDWLTTGPRVAAFEERFAMFVHAKEAVAVSSGTSALHAAMFALGIGPGDEVIVPTMTFVATANAVVYQGGTPVLVDCDPETLLVDPARVEAAITPRTKAIVTVDYAGQPCAYGELRTLAHRQHLPIVADACHALGGSYRGENVGSIADMSTFSFHAVKPLATGEGGMITTNDASFARRMRRFRNHGIEGDHRERQERGSWYYEMIDLGNNYRLTDLQCALGLTELPRIPAETARRQEIAGRYDQAFAPLREIVAPLVVRPEVSHAYHLYVVRLRPGALSAPRAEIFRALRAENIGVNVHYIPVHLHPFYRKRFGTKEGMFPVAEQAYEEILSLPLFAGMTDSDATDVIEAVMKVIAYYRKTA